MQQQGSWKLQSTSLVFPSDQFVSKQVEGNHAGTLRLIAVKNGATY